MPAAFQPTRSVSLECVDSEHLRILNISLACTPQCVCRLAAGLVILNCMGYCTCSMAATVVVNASSSHQTVVLSAAACHRLSRVVGITCKARGPQLTEPRESRLGHQDCKQSSNRTIKAQWHSHVSVKSPLRTRASRYDEHANSESPWPHLLIDNKLPSRPQRLLQRRTLAALVQLRSARKRQ